MKRLNIKEKDILVRISLLRTSKGAEIRIEIAKIWNLMINRRNKLCFHNDRLEYGRKAKARIHKEFKILKEHSGCTCYDEEDLFFVCDKFKEYIYDIEDYITFKIPDKDNSIWDNIPKEIKVEDLKIFGDAKRIFERWINYGEMRSF